MLGLVEALIAIAAITMTCRVAGRIPAMMLTAVAAAAAAIIMPPFLSWGVESTTDVLTVVFQSIIGLAVAYRWPAKIQREQPLTRLFIGRNEPRFSLLTIMQAIFKRDQDLAARLRDIEVQGELHEPVAISQDEMEHLLSDVMRLALSESRIRRVKIYTSHRPSIDQITLAAEYNDPAALPRLRILGRLDIGRPIRMQGWPVHCSTTSFDNGFEHTYQISIRKVF